MSFLQQAFLLALPLALIPVIIHLINQNRHRTVKWAAMMFLLDAKKMTKGIARLRQILILTMRVLAVAALLLAAGRPLASGWLAMTGGGEAETVIVLLDRSASMEQQNLETGKSKRSTALEKIADVLGKTSRRSRIVLIESGALEEVELTGPGDLLDLPSAAGTDSAADITGMLQAALDYITTNRSGRTDVWLASDLRAGDWNPASGRWETLRAAFAELDGVNFFLLNYPEIESENLSVSVGNLRRRRGTEGMELVFDLSILRQSPGDAPLSVPLEITVNGARTQEMIQVGSGEFRLQGYTIGLGNSKPSGWGRIDLPADANPLDNTYFFVFDEEPVLKTVIVSDDSQSAGAIAAAASSPVDRARRYASEVLPVSRRAEVPWEETALLFWQAPLPAADSPEAGLLEQFVASGKSLVLLPPETLEEQGGSLLGIRWVSDAAQREPGPFEIGWWRTDSGLLRNTQNGDPLPLGATRVFRVADFEGEHQSLLKLKDGRSVVARGLNKHPGNLFVWATLPRSSHSSLASDGVAFFVMIHRALDQGRDFLANAQMREVGEMAPGDEVEWERISYREDEAGAVNPLLHAGAFRARDRWIALNRPATEDEWRILEKSDVSGLFAGLNYRIITDSVDNRSSLAAEIWRMFLIAMALALIAEAALCLPPAREMEPAHSA